VCLAAAMALIFAGTLAQVHLGIHEAQQRYFQSMFVWWPPDGRGFQIPIFPGGHLIGSVLLDQFSRRSPENVSAGAGGNWGFISRTLG